MARPRESLADRLARAEKAACEGVIRSEQLSRRDREVLTDEGWLSPVMRGWYLLSTPAASASKGESTAWFSSIWSFLRVYLTHRYGDGWCFSAGDSLAPACWGHKGAQAGGCHRRPRRSSDAATPT